MKRAILFFFFVLSLEGSVISDYRVTHYCTTASDGSEIVVLRSFKRNNTPAWLTLNTHTLQTAIVESLPAAQTACRTSRYSRLLAESISAPAPLQNDGITHGQRGVVLTTDLCPSSKEGFEYRLYASVIAHFRHPVPVTLFVTGRWIEKHPKAWQQLIRWDREKKLAITWGNHTYTHPYHPKAALEKNFALSPGYPLREDTLKLEKTLIANALTPSIFFRFPGLVSNTKQLEQIHDLGLITIGSDTWLAKGHSIKEGSILLLHGNKNEPRGVEIFLKAVTQGALTKIDALAKSISP